MKNSTIENNTIEYNGAFRASEVDELEMYSKWFLNNENKSFYNADGAISLFDSGNIIIKNSVFKNNKLSEDEVSSEDLGGGAIEVHHFFADAMEETSTLIEESIFENNEMSQSVE